MNLEEFKREMESDASKRCEVQAETIVKLIEANKRQAEHIVCLQNRCYAQTRGTLCIFCGIRESCPYVLTPPKQNI